mmetsp:Transcript_33266/g.51020  ORF Transcript_33266/g.51020 Transcript_33266/m.51020 type:complete len:142 (+) Transcript_33266:374-799(+)
MGYLPFTSLTEGQEAYSGETDRAKKRHSTSSFSVLTIVLIALGILLAIGLTRISRVGRGVKSFHSFIPNYESFAENYTYPLDQAQPILFTGEIVPYAQRNKAVIKAVGKGDPKSNDKFKALIMNDIQINLLVADYKYVSGY